MAYSQSSSLNDQYYLKSSGVKKGANKDEIKSAYRRLAKTYHPDKLSGIDESVKKIAEEKFKEIKEAYENLIKEPGYV